RRSLLTVVSWSAMALCFFPRTVTRASLGYTRSTPVVSGTTWTRLRCLLAASLLTMTAGRSLRTSPPTAGSKLTHQTLPRFIGHVPHGGLGPFQRLGLACLLLGHLLVRAFEVRANDIGAHQRLDELADAPPADDGV